MRWSGQSIDNEDAQALPGMARMRGFIRSVQTPEFAGITFHEVAAKSALNKVPGPSRMPFGWTVNPYRGCSHACRYCYARASHEWLELDTGKDFDTQIVVKTNVAEVLRAELMRRSWCHETVALGTNTDPYQRAEGRYRLMPRIIDAFAESGTPFSILTKGTLLRRDIALIRSAARSVEVGLGVSLAIGHPALHESIEPGTPTPTARLDLIRAITDAGLGCGVMLAPVLPSLTDDEESLDRLLGQIAAAGATGVTVLALHLRPGAFEWYFSWLGEHRPDLLPLYRVLYANGPNVPEWYGRKLHQRVAPLLRRHGLNSRQIRRPDASLAESDADSGFPAGLAMESAPRTPPVTGPAEDADEPALF
jgi:DNA repair photolyase